jgi:hypothetical protein
MDIIKKEIKKGDFVFFNPPWIVESDLLYRIDKVINRFCKNNINWITIKKPDEIKDRTFSKIHNIAVQSKLYV